MLPFLVPAKIVIKSEKIEQECLIQNKDEFPYDLYLIKMAGPLKLSMFSALLPFLMQYIFGLGQAILLTNQVVSVQQDLVAFGKTLLIKNFPNVVQCSSVETTNQLFEKLLKSSDTNILKKLLKLFLH